MKTRKFDNYQNDNNSIHIEQKPCILAVDDHEDSLILLTQFLECLGFSSLSASNAQQTYLLAKKYQPDLILLDIVLPDIDGIELQHHLKQNKLTQDITIVALTALALAEEREQIIQAGFDDYLVKPYVLGDLEALIYRHLQGEFPHLNCYHYQNHNWQQQEASVPGQK